MTKAQMVERIHELEKEVEALKAGATVETHIHYHYPQQEVPATPNWTWPWHTPYYVGDTPYIPYSGGGTINLYPVDGGV